MILIHHRVGQLAGIWQMFFCVVFGLKGDLEHHSSALSLNNPSSAKPCCKCQCDIRDDSKPWTDARPTAAWVPTIWTATAWEAAHPNRNILFTLPGVAILSVMIDFMHTKHLGTDQYFYGSVLYMLVFMIMRGTVQENLDCIFQHLCKYWKELDVRPKL